MDNLENLVIKNKKGKEYLKEVLINYIKLILRCIQRSNRVYVRNSETFTNKLYSPDKSIYIHNSKIYIPEIIINRILEDITMNELLDLLEMVFYKDHLNDKCINRKVLEKNSYRRVTVNSSNTYSSKLTIIAFNYVALRHIARDLSKEGVSN